MACICQLISCGQAIDNTVSFRNINSDHYFRLNYENDYFTKTDRDYSQGIYLEWVNPRIQRFLLSRLLWHPRDSHPVYGLSIEQDVYTPNHYDKPNIQFGDRPFAGVLLLKSFLVATNVARAERISSQLSVGVMGPAAGGQGMQEGIHRWLHDITPHGWPNQVKNDVEVNYQVNYERELYHFLDYFSLASYNSARLGTLSDKLSSGLTGMLGQFSSPFRYNNSKRKKTLQYYVYDQLSLNLVGYDATLEGGLFNRSSPYTVPYRQFNPVTLQNRYGAVLIVKKLYLEYYQTSLTEEFRPSVFHRTGGIQIGFGFE